MMYKFQSGFAEQIKDYLHFRKEMGFSNAHAESLQSFDRFCCDMFPKADILNQEIVRSWFPYEIANGRKGFIHKASAIRIFAQYIGGNAYILPMEYVPRKPKFVPYIPTRSELIALFDAAEAINIKGGSFMNYTLTVMLKLMYTCGLRPSECRHLLRDNVSFKTGEILITKTKRNKERIVVMSDDMLQIIKQFDIQRKITIGSFEYFFVNTSGLPFSSSTLSSLVTRCWIAANPNVEEQSLPHLRAYDLRHCYASTILQKWIDEGRNLYAMLPYLRTYMGHERIEDTAYYIHILPERLLSSPGVDWNELDSVIPEVSVWKN